MTQFAGTVVSRETADRLSGYEALLRRWQKKINLVSPKSLADLRNRHIADSLQLIDLIEDGVQSWADLGSGAGLPGIPCAIALAETRPDLTLTLIESDQRKASFLREAARLFCPSARVIARRIEDVPALGADVVSARALAPLDRLLPLVARHLETGGTALLPKGATWEKEVAAVTGIWHFQQTVHPSRIDASGVILQIRGLARVQA